MDIRRLEVFCRVVELGSFTKAAEAVLLSQPTISEHIKTLEEMVGERLVDRLGREVAPTPAGKILYRYAKKIIQIKEEAVQAMAAYRGDLAGTVHVGASTIPGNYILPRLIGSFKQHHPAVQISVFIGATKEVAEAVADGKQELGLVGSQWKDRRLSFERIFADELVLAVPRNHPWASLPSIPVERLAEEPFIARHRGSGTRMVTYEILEKAGFDTSRLRVVAEMSTTEAVRQSIKAGIGISILSRQAVAEDAAHGSVRLVAIDGVTFHRAFYLVKRRGREPSPVSEALERHLKAHNDHPFPEKF
ncbi:selenium metabolism-associated LysR family transcriptional regulator [Desulfosoma caldarium]|uniref:DNA-binding transcriptional LysR family regulator n=1 Tax=Desulfosoma caldarium TaxID=610254 RepID=A0A3N1VJE0_9BACT|nr:selenium metabolism-associated LysR family transcriptional regulator [Desulfosoma caldarium]ROR02924.1 DNA-binding transcriptional LysR family regulator [Desulfosoma caldarium]